MKNSTDDKLIHSVQVFSNVSLSLLELRESLLMVMRESRMEKVKLEKMAVDPLPTS